MKTRLGIVCLLMVGGVLAMGCGNYGPQQMEEASLSSIAEGEEPSASIPPEESAQDPEEAGPGEVEELSACCHVKCSDGLWRGPFTGVKFDNCKKYGKYFCPAYGHGNYSSHAWKGC
ncbi:hypothetical protein SAMN05444354_103325 [Stigmatella aurantiaca]|uniref:Lipoprotein n=1 Tax=Stigmatella aurantiaca TaxID=41 RepID=A0A1H7LSF5_STIAU|nr:hypothetical protein [Stigmatella aurantiaca]SEL01870.1 hypothetical protein SAMN05444354_103325 [Stigmatella aurantiaca]